MKHYLFTVVHDYEGDFGQLIECETLDEAVATATEFENAHSDEYCLRLGWDWQILKGEAVLQGDSNGKRPRKENT